MSNPAAPPCRQRKFAVGVIYASSSSSLPEYHVGSELGWSDLFWTRTLPSANAKWTPRIALFGDMGRILSIWLLNYRVTLRQTFVYFIWIVPLDLVWAGGNLADLA